MDTPPSTDHMPALIQLCKGSCSCWISPASKRSPEGLFSNYQLLTNKPINSQIKVYS